MAVWGGEYWLVDPQLKQLTIFGRDRQKFTPHNFDLAVDPVALSHALTGFQPRLAEIFRERQPQSQLKSL